MWKWTSKLNTDTKTLTSILGFPQVWSVDIDMKYKTK